MLWSPAAEAPSTTILCRSAIIEQVDDDNADGIAVEGTTKKEEQEELGILRLLVNYIVKQRN